MSLENIVRIYCSGKNINLSVRRIFLISRSNENNILLICLMICKHDLIYLYVVINTDVPNIYTKEINWLSIIVIVFQ